MMWLIVGLLLVGAEMLVGAFYLLILGSACLVAGAAGWAGASPSLQFAIAALVAVTGTLLLRKYRSTRTEPPAINPGMGQPVTPVAWKSPIHPRVRYRGCEWDAELENGPTGPETPALENPPQVLYISGQHGNILRVRTTPPADQPAAGAF